MQAPAMAGRGNRLWPCGLSDFRCVRAAKCLDSTGIFGLALPQILVPPDADSQAEWCGKGAAVILPRVPIN